MCFNTIYTAGYGNLSISNFLEQLFQNKITKVVDIRSRPYSRFQPKFNKTQLPGILYNEGISYLFKGEELGGKPSNKMLYTADRLNYDLVKSTREYQSAIEEVIELTHQGETLCLMCCELNPDNCHRKTLVGETLMKRGITIKHILSKGGVEEQANETPFLHLF